MSRSIFEEVGEDGAARDKATAAPRPAEADALKARNRARVALWLWCLAGLVVVQILIGGLTRVTDSGLSITDWRPIMGAIPPLSEADWQAVLERYRATAEYQQQNAGMTLAEFKTIYWWEWIHRMSGRLIGLVFVIPFAVFLIRRALPPGWTGRIALMGGLGALQGVIGMWMVMSGLDRLDVQPGWLATHLGLAFVILGLLMWAGLSLRRSEADLLQARRRREKGLFGFAGAVTALVFLQILFAAFVSGMDAGLVHQTWPSMEGAFYPANTPFHPFSDPAAAQFVHRIGAYALVIAALVFAWRAQSSSFAASRRWGLIVGGLALGQMTVGVAALLHGVPASWAILHQLGGIVLFAAAIHAKHQLAFPKEEKIASA
ncbi:MAG: COX15/CtaA family protein [Pseudomonadota bacterium]